MTNETKVMQLTARKNLLLSRDPVANANLVRKIERQIRKYSTKEWCLCGLGLRDIFVFINGNILKLIAFMQLKQNLLVLSQAIVVLSAAKPKVRVFTPNGFAAISLGIRQVGKARDFDSRIFAGSSPASPAKGITAPLYGKLLVPVCKNVGCRPYSSFGQESCKPYRTVGL